MIIKEYECMAHGAFEAGEPMCPHGCEGDIMVQRVFRTAPSIQSARYRGINSTLQSLADEHGLTDMSNADGQGMRRANYATQRRLDHAMDVVLNSSGRPLSDYYPDIRQGSGLAVSNSARPIGEVVRPAADTVSAGTGSIIRDESGQISLGNGMQLARPRAAIEGRYDGAKAGLPTGD